MRIEIPKTIYHVISRGNNKSNIFLDDKDYNVFLKQLIDVKSEKNFLLYAYCLMPNHFHLLIESIEEPLSNIMQKLLTLYAIYFKSRHDRTGHVFQGRYKAKICDKEEYLFKLMQYIHVNPLRAGIIKDINNYKWSSHLVYAGKTNNNNLSKEKLFRRMDCNSAAQGHRVYKNLIGEFINENTWQFKKLTLDEILQEISIGTKLSKNDILSDSQEQKIILVRKNFSYSAANDFDYTLKEISDFINKDKSVISRYIKQIKDKNTIN